MTHLTMIDMASRTRRMAEKKKKRWIQDAKIKEGAFTAKAKAAGKSVQAYAREKKDAPGKTGKQARLAMTFEKIADRKKKMYTHERSKKD